MPLRPRRGIGTLAADDDRLGPGLRCRSAPPSLCPVATRPRRFTAATRRTEERAEEVWRGRRKCGAVLVRPDATHEVDARGASTLLIGFISAESDMGACRALRAHRRRDSLRTRPPKFARWRAVLGPTPNDARAERWLTEFLPHRRRRQAIHPGVRRVLSYLQEPPDRVRRSVSEVAGGHCGPVALALHACVYRVSRRSCATLPSLAPASARVL